MRKFQLFTQYLIMQSANNIFEKIETIHIRSE